LVQPDDPLRDDVRALLETHLQFAYTQSPPEDVYALNAEALVADDITFFSIREDGHVRAVGALRELDPTHAEIKSMHTAAAARGRGLGATMLEHLLGVARQRGYQRVSLETGTTDAFDPARRLYESAGFERCEPFADYRPSTYSLCMTLVLE
jgi:putative acetyltransferase